MREPLATYKSNMKFDGGISPEMLISNIEYTHQLFLQYRDQGLNPIPLAYELAALGDESFKPMFELLGLPYTGLEYDMEALRNVSEGGKYVPGESAHPDEYREIVSPTFAKGRFIYMDGASLSPADFINFTHLPGANTSAGQLAENAQEIENRCLPLYRNFLIVSAQSLGVTGSVEKLDVVKKLR